MGRGQKLLGNGLDLLRLFVIIFDSFFFNMDKKRLQIHIFKGSTSMDMGQPLAHIKPIHKFSQLISNRS
ncbi:hypothetical protein TCAL_06609 [Tigriopus californicus]|uniref:Uncharacterized protein n=1 Tax=Tigriopus californicus TaxID=6832 RepID=A0A553PQ19_TIGCA|nr:hypothetical protein TCAL_06609 [Tigriopus californicus]